ncbi:cytochrome c [Thermomonas sp.]|uniref:cytochrome c n=1 Tax=Thermomonas sp. TaxID=1971895 RepID=UPI0024872059|nr:cytochrome c [Thermomonas sp.]MDI1253302.1 cytochrome c [Thermomonas sp.]
MTICFLGVLLALSGCKVQSPPETANHTAHRAAPMPAATASAEKQPVNINVGAQLPPKVRGLLIQEMQAILGATQAIQAAIVQGDHETVASKAQAIHDSFIMDQQMTAADKQALLAAVPDAFLERDKAFHEISAQLAQAGRDRDTKHELRQFSEMVDGCVACHTQYATARFPGL